MDDLLIYAYQRYVDTTCQECGGYLRECRNPQNRNAYVVDTTGLCVRSEAMQRHTKDEKFNPEPGQLFSVKPIDESLIHWIGY